MTYKGALTPAMGGGSGREDLGGCPLQGEDEVGAVSLCLVPDLTPVFFDGMLHEIKAETEAVFLPFAP